MCCSLRALQISKNCIFLNLGFFSAVLIRRRRCRNITYANWYWQWNAIAMKEVGEYFGCMKQSRSGETIGTWLDLTFSLVVAEDLSPCPISIAGAAFPGLSARCSFPRQLLLYSIAAR
jgi:hypothetical protein